MNPVAQHSEEVVYVYVGRTLVASYYPSSAMRNVSWWRRALIKLAEFRLDTTRVRVTP